MEKPENPQLDTILATVDDIREAEAMIAALKTKLATEIATLAGIPDRKLRRSIGVYAYWIAPELNANDLALATVGKRSSAAMLKGFTTSIDIMCERCKADIEVSSRTQMRQLSRSAAGQTYPLPEGFRVICGECREEIFEERRVAGDVQRALSVQRERDLLAMPYADFVRTADWADIRDHYLYHLLAIGRDLLCEICSAPEPLSVIHKAPRTVGEFDKLALQCAGCTELLSAGNKLPFKPDPANAVSRRHLDRITLAFLRQQGRDPDLASDLADLA